MKPFNLELSKAGHPVQTRDGKPARIVCFDRKSGNQPIMALITVEDGNEVGSNFCKNGMFYADREESCLDLFRASQKHEGWANIYPAAHLEGNRVMAGIIYNTEEEAKKNISGVCIATVHIEWEE